jgi:outer membrane protein
MVHKVETAVESTGMAWRGLDWRGLRSRRTRVGWRTYPTSACLILLLCTSLQRLRAQDVPASPTKPWHTDREAQFAQRLEAYPEPKYNLAANRTYTLAELVDLAEGHNPETRLAWQNAKAEAATVGVAKAELFPTVAAVALAETSRTGVLIGQKSHRQTVGLFQPTLNLNYLIFDFGGRSGAIAEAKANLFAADFAFNDTHRKIIYQVTATYYRLLNAIGQQNAAKATLVNAQTVQQDAEARLDHGLATLPDVLEARAAAAQADYDLQAAIGAQEIAHGDLSTALGLQPGTQFCVQNISELSIPDALTETADEAVDYALEQRPDLMEQVTKVRAADAALEQARSSYFPSLSFSGLGGLQRGYGQQDLLPGTYAQGETWNVQLNLQWTLFDGARREDAIAEAKARRAQAQAGVAAERDQIADEVWIAYSNARTALRQKQAAAALLTSADQSYTAALRAYDLGVRNLLDVVAAQRALAQARSADVSARAQVLTKISNLAFRTGDILRTPVPNAGP